MKPLTRSSWPIPGVVAVIGPPAIAPCTRATQTSPARRKENTPAPAPEGAHWGCANVPSCSLWAATGLPSVYVARYSADVVESRSWLPADQVNPVTPGRSTSFEAVPAVVSATDTPASVTYT